MLKLMHLNLEKLILQLNYLSDLVPQYQGDERLLSTLTPFTYWIKMNEKNEALANVNIREAIAKAFDKDAMVKNILNDGSQTANFFIPKDFVSL